MWGTHVERKVETKSLTLFARLRAHARFSGITLTEGYVSQKDNQGQGFSLFFLGILRIPLSFLSFSFRFA
jgi:hypothetical protein